MTGSLQVKNDIYYIVLSYKDTFGKRKQKWINTKLKTRGNKRKADELLRNTIAEWEEKNLDYCDLTVADYFEKWLNEQSNLVSPNTFRAYKGNMENHIIPYFKAKNLKIQDLRVFHLEEYYNLKASSSSCVSNKKLSAQTIKHHHQNISKALNDAVHKEILRFNPAVNARTPKVNKFVGSFLNDTQINELIKLFKDTPIELLVEFLCTYGLRRSEAIALSWDDIDFDNNQFTVSSAILQHSGGDYKRNCTKNISSYRTLPLTGHIKQKLIVCKQEQEKNRELFGNCFIDNNYVFTWPDGKLVSPNYLSRTFHKIIEKSSLPKVRVHDLRHSVASNLLSKGFSVVEVAQWLGHSEASTTLNFYAHVDSSSKRNIVKVLERLDSLENG